LSMLWSKWVTMSLEVLEFETNPKFQNPPLVQTFQVNPPTEQSNSKI
jgi:hypothetical protein